MPIKVYPSALEGEPIEVHHTTETMSVLDWLQGNVPGFRYDADHQIVVYVNGEQCPVADWPLTQFGPDAEVRIVVEPRGIDPITAIVIAAVVVAAGAAVMMSRMSRVQTPTGTDRPTGTNLGNERINANAPRLGEPIPEIAGSPIRYPDYLVPPYRRFDPIPEDGRISLKANQYIGALMCVGRGDYEIIHDSVKIGDTPASKLEGRLQYGFHGPGTYLPDTPAFWRWWHTPDEVGFTSFGGAGIELTGSSAGEAEGGNVPEWFPEAISNANWPVITFVENNDLIMGAYVRTVPSQWREGTVIRMHVPWTVTEHVVGGVSYYACALWDSMNLDVGQMAHLDKDPSRPGVFVPGAYEVVDIIPASGPTPTLYQFDRDLDGLPTDNIRVLDHYRIKEIGGYWIRVTRALDGTWPGFPSEGAPTQASAEDPDHPRAKLVLISLTGEMEDEDPDKGWQGWFTACPVGETADMLELDLVMPAGWGHYDDEGRLTDLEGRLEVQIRYEGETNTHTFTKSWTGWTPNQWGFTYEIPLDPPGRVDVRCRLNPGPRGSSRYADRVQWSGLKARIVGAPTQYDGVTTMWAWLQVGDDIGSGAENKISVRAERVLPTLEDQTVAVRTRDIAPFVLYVLQSVGYTREQIDMTTLGNYHGIWSSREDTFDAVFDSSTTVKTVVNHALQAGFSELTITGGQIGFARDVRRVGIPSRVFGPHALTAPLVETTQCPQPDDIDGVDAEYKDYLTGTSKVIQYRLGTDVGIRVQKISLVGVTKESKAFQIAARVRRAAAYRRTQFVGETELQAMNCTYWSYVGLQDGTPEYGQTAYVVARSGNTLTLSEPAEPGTEIISFVRRDGTVTDPVPVASVNGQTVVTASVPITLVLPGAAEDPTIVYLGTMARWMVPALIESIEPRAEGKTQFRAVNYDERVYSDDEGDPLPTQWLESMGDLVLWLDAYERGTIVESVGGVMEMRDRSQAGNDAWQDQVGRRPLVAEDKFLPRALKFDIVEV